MDAPFLFRSALRRITASVGESIYLRGGPDLTVPFTIRGIVTERCNYRCAYCAFGRTKPKDEELTIDEWCAALASLRKFAGPFLIQFSGGEPFAKHGFLDLLESCRRQRIRFGLITNGSALNQRTCARLASARPFNVDVSVDSPRATVHDTVRGAPGSLARIEEGIRRLVEARNAEQAAFPVRIKVTVHRANLGSLVDLVHWTRRCGATSIDFSPVRRWTPEVERDLWIREPTEIARLEADVRQLIEMKRCGAPIETSETKLDTFADHFSDRVVPLAVSPCRVGMRDYQIRPNGDVEVCWHHRPIGNVRASTAAEIWRGELASRVRRATVACELFKVHSCAHSCLGHQPVRQVAKRALMLVRETRAQARTDRADRHA